METSANIVRQSGFITRATMNFTAQQLNFFAYVMKEVGFIYNGVKVKDGCVSGLTPQVISKLSEREFIIPKKDLLPPGSRNSVDLTESVLAITENQSVVVRTDRGVMAMTLFDRICCPDNGPFFSVRMTRSFFEIMANLSIGMSVYDFDVMMRLKSIYAKRMYALIARRNNDNTLYIQLEDMRDIMGANVRDRKTGKIVERNYTDNYTFEKETLRKAKAMLDDKSNGSPYGFDYKRVKDGNKTAGYIITVTCDSSMLPASEKTFMRKKDDDSAYVNLGPQVVAKLKEMGWTMSNIQANLPLLTDACKQLDLLAELSYLNGKSRNGNVRNRIGYVVNALKGKIYSSDSGNILEKAARLMNRTDF